MCRGLNGLRSGIKRHVGLTWIKKKPKQNQYIKQKKTQEEDRGETFLIFFLSFYSFKSYFSDSRVSNRHNSSG